MRNLREWTPAELEVVETVEEIVAKYDELKAVYDASPTPELLEMSRKLDNMRFDTAKSIGVSAARCNFAEPTVRRFTLRRELLAQL